MQRPLHESDVIEHEERQILIAETAHFLLSKMPRKAFMRRISDIDFLLNGTKSGN